MEIPDHLMEKVQWAAVLAADWGTLAEEAFRAGDNEGGLRYLTRARRESERVEALVTMFVSVAPQLVATIAEKETPSPSASSCMRYDGRYSHLSLISKQFVTE